MVKLILIATALLLFVLVAGAYWSFRRASKEAEAAMASIVARAKPPTALFDERMLVGPPGIAQRYFRHAVAPGTPFYRTVRLEMSGTFLLGDKARAQAWAMTARQVLAAFGVCVDTLDEVRDDTHLRFRCARGSESLDPVLDQQPCFGSQSEGIAEPELLGLDPTRNGSNLGTCEPPSRRRRDVGTDWAR